MHAGHRQQPLRRSSASRLLVSSPPAARQAEHCGSRRVQSLSSRTNQHHPVAKVTSTPKRILTHFVVGLILRAELCIFSRISLVRARHRASRDDHGGIVKHVPKRGVRNALPVVQGRGSRGSRRNEKRIEPVVQPELLEDALSSVSDGV